MARDRPKTAPARSYRSVATVRSSRPPTNRFHGRPGLHRGRRAYRYRDRRIRGLHGP